MKDDKKDEMIVLEGVTRFEYINDQGRAVVDYLKDGERYIYCYQDDGKTLKIFKSKSADIRIP